MLSKKYYGKRVSNLVKTNWSLPGMPKLLSESSTSSPEGINSTLKRSIRVADSIINISGQTRSTRKKNIVKNKDLTWKRSGCFSPARSAGKKVCASLCGSVAKDHLAVQRKVTIFINVTLGDSPWSSKSCLSEGKTVFASAAFHLNFAIFAFQQMVLCCLCASTLTNNLVTNDAFFSH